MEAELQRVNMISASAKLISSFIALGLIKTTMVLGSEEIKET